MIKEATTKTDGFGPWQLRGLAPGQLHTFPRDFLRVPAMGLTFPSRDFRYGPLFCFAVCKGVVVSLKGRVRSPYYTDWFENRRCFFFAGPTLS